MQPFGLGFLTVSLIYSLLELALSGLSKETDLMCLEALSGLSKETDLMCLGALTGRLNWMEATIQEMSFQRGFDIGAIYERLKADIIFIIYVRFTSELCFRYSLVYSSRQLDIILKSYIFYLILSVKSTLDCFLLVMVELPLPLTSSLLLLKLITLIVFLLFLFFLSAPTLVFCLPLLNLVTELLEWPRWTEVPKDCTCSWRGPQLSFQSVLSRWQLGVRSLRIQSDPFFLCLDYWWEMDC